MTGTLYVKIHFLRIMQKKNRSKPNVHLNTIYTFSVFQRIEFVSWRVEFQKRTTFTSGFHKAEPW